MITGPRLCSHFGIFYVFTITGFVVYYYFCYNGQLFPLNVASFFFPNGSPYSVEYGRKNRSKVGSNFHYHWLRMHRARTDWRGLLGTCSDQAAWGTLKLGWGKVNRSSARTSYVSWMDIQPSQQYSRIFIQTRTSGGQQKNIGGDFWRVFFKGPANVSATVFDHRNGTYEAIALLVEPGNYNVRAYLDYSLCDGLRDPPKDWFRLGKHCRHLRGIWNYSTQNFIEVC